MIEWRVYLAPTDVCTGRYSRPCACEVPQASRRLFEFPDRSLFAPVYGISNHFLFLESPASQEEVKKKVRTSRIEKEKENDVTASGPASDAIAGRVRSSIVNCFI